ncbi:Adhesin yadA precursor [Cedecea lapagei]|uniref:Adhesin yadA n=1 Tax=Cedecea lapagei TaxID=158823 RepID=A0A3S4KW60_9ENTR|nr:YadA-like family protein [Cedecea lapagei]VEC00516.1 Adhesin yadA precursor [Cedecea lapagei]
MAAVAGTSNSIALGSGAVTAGANAVTGGTINGTAFTYAGGAPVGVLSIGAAGSERQITNVAAGRITATSTDGVNGSQLFATNTAVNGIGTTLTNINNGAGIKFFHTNSLLADSSATGTNSVAVGPAASATAANALAFGNGATAGTANSVALGNGATAGTANSVALGNGAVTAGANAVTGGTINGTAFTYAGGAPVGVLSLGAAGSERQITNVAAGQITATSTDAVNGSQLFATNTAVNSLGSSLTSINNGAGIKYFHTNSLLADSSATGTDSVAVGPAASATAANALAFGNGATAGTANSVALGNGAVTAGANAVTGGTINGTAFTYAGGAPVGVLSLGAAGSERQITNLAAGQITATSTDGVNGSQLFATNTTVNSLGSSLTSINNGAGIKYFHTNSLLADSSATGTNSVAVGPAASATAANALAFGNGATAGTANSVALGNGAVTAGANAVTGGTINGTAFTYAGGAPVGVLSVGAAGSERQITNVAAGRISGTSTDAVNGSQLFATNTSVNSLGTSLNNIVNNGTGIKYFHANSLLADSFATGTDSVAVGPAASATAANALAFGNGATAGTANSVALGSGSVTAGANAVTGDTINGTAFTYAGGAPVGVLSLGAAGSERQITNLAAGRISNTSTDAVNGSQLFATNTSVNSLGTSLNNIVNNGTGIKYFHANSLLADSFATGTDSVAVGPSASATAANALALGNGATAGTANSVALGSGAVTAGANAVTGGTINGTAFTYAGGAPVGVLSLGAAGSERQITNVAAGQITATSTDAVNGSQLFATNTAVNSLGSSLTSINNGAGIKYFHANSLLADSFATGTDSVAVGPAASATAANALAFGNGATAGTANSVALGSGAVTAAANAVTGDTINGTAFTYAGGAPVGVLSLGAAGSERQITNLAAGRISNTSTDAVNGSQLFATNTSVNSLGTSLNNIVNNGSGIKYFHANSLLADSSATGTDSVAVGPSASATAANALAFGNGATAGTANSVALGNGAVTAAANAVTGDTINGTAFTYAGGAPVGVLSLGAADSERQITNVAAGRISSTSTDAVNGSQLFATNTSVNSLGTSLNNIVNNGTGIKYFHANSLLADSSATGTDSVAIGPQSVSSGAQSLAAGAGATASTNGGVALGNQTSVQVLGGVALGQGAISDRAIVSSVGSIPVGSGAIRYDTSDATLLGAVSLGKAGEYRQITNLADGTSAQDAVTLRQLTGAIGSISSTGTMYFHANSTNPQDSLAAGQESIAVGPGTVVNGDNGIGIGNQSVVGQSAVGGIAIGRNSQVQLASGIAIGSQAEAQGEQSLALGAGAVATQATSIALGSSSITTVGAQTGYTAYGLSSPQTSVGELGIGTALGDRKITGVAAGSAANDAVNVAQLTAVGDQVALNTSNITSLGGRVTTIEGSINNISNGGGVKYFHANSTQADSVASGANSVAIGSNAVASGDGALASGNGAQASGAGTVAVGNGATASADGSVALGQGSSDNGRGAENYTGKYSNASNVTAGTVSVGNTATGETRTVSNVADGVQATDAVNLRQLDGAVAESKQYTDNSLSTINNSINNVTGSIAAVDSRVTQVEGNVNNLQNGTDGMFQVNNTSASPKPSATGTNAVAGGAGSVASGNNSAAIGTNAKASGANSVAMGNGASATANNSVAVGANSVANRDNSFSVGAVGSERQVTNVATATQGTDAVNLDQLNKSVSNITNNANSYTDNRFSELKRDVDKQDDRLSAGIASAMAMASLTQPYSPGASMVSLGAASYRDQSALSLGVSTISDNGHWVGKLQGSTNTQGNASIGVGIGYQW